MLNAFTSLTARKNVSIMYKSRSPSAWQKPNFRRAEAKARSASRARGEERVKHNRLVNMWQMHPGYSKEDVRLAHEKLVSCSQTKSGSSFELSVPVCVVTHQRALWYVTDWYLAAENWTWITYVVGHFRFSRSGGEMKWMVTGYKASLPC